MRVIVKKVYCPYCNRLTSVQEQANNNLIFIACSRCHNPLYNWDGTRWKWKRGLASQPAPNVAAAKLQKKEAAKKEKKAPSKKAKAAG